MNKPERPDVLLAYTLQAADCEVTLFWVLCMN